MQKIAVMIKNRENKLLICAALVAGALAAAPACAGALDGGGVDSVAGTCALHCPASDCQTVDAQAAPEFAGGGILLIIK